MSTSPLSVAYYFRRLGDPRRNHLKRHELLDIVVITLCAVIAGSNDWQQVAIFARCQQDWLGRFLSLSNGIPSHDTFERVFDRIDPHAFQACFRQWVEALTATLNLKHIAIDGKTLRHSGNAPKGWKPLHLVSAWASQCQLSLGQVAVEEKSNEITAIPQLLELLDIKGALVTIDAMGCQKDIAEKVIEGGGDYVLTVKENQPHLLEDIRICLEKALDSDAGNTKIDTYESEDRGHGRIEKRSYTILTDPEEIRNKEEWQDLNVVGICVSERIVAGKTSEEVRYFIGSRRASAKIYAQALRNHWGIENNLHWQLDVTFREDNNRVQRRHGAENLALIRRLALCLLKRHAGKESMARKRYEASMNPTFLAEILKSGENSGKA